MIKNEKSTVKNQRKKRGFLFLNLLLAICYLFLVPCILITAFTSCQREWRPGMPLPKERVKIAVLHISDPFTENSGYAYAHQIGIEEMKKNLGLDESQILYETHLDYSNPFAVESRIRDFIAQGVNIIIATSWGYMNTCEKLAEEFPGVVFANATGNKHNDTNFTNYFGRAYQARYLSGIIAGAKTETNKIGYVAARGIENSEVTGGINAFAMGVERVNHEATIHVRVTHSWYDPMGEAAAARSLIAEGCDIIAQHVDTPNPQIEAQRAGVWGIGYNTDMSTDAPNAVLTSVHWNWGVYYTFLVQSIIDGSFITTPWYGSLKDGVIDLAPLNGKILWETETLRLLEAERRRIESGELSVFGDLSDNEIRSGINWYYRNVRE